MEKHFFRCLWTILGLKTNSYSFTYFFTFFEDTRINHAIGQGFLHGKRKPNKFRLFPWCQNNFLSFFYYILCPPRKAPFRYQVASDQQKIKAVQTLLGSRVIFRDLLKFFLVLIDISSTFVFFILLRKFSCIFVIINSMLKKKSTSLRLGNFS